MNKVTFGFLLANAVFCICEMAIADLQKHHEKFTKPRACFAGMDGKGQKSDRRMHSCQDKNEWHLESRKRILAKHCDDLFEIYLDIAEVGNHAIPFSMHEDHFDLDKFLLTQNHNFIRLKRIDSQSPIRGGLIGESHFETLSKKPFPKLMMPRMPDGNGEIRVSGELKKWHKISLTLDGPYAHERDRFPNPFRDRAMYVRFTHDSGSPNYLVPGFFAADGKAAQSSAKAGTKWRAHFVPDAVGIWHARVSFQSGRNAAIDERVQSQTLHPYHDTVIRFSVIDSDKKGRDFRAKGRLQYVGKRYLRFADSKEYFLKAGADAPETFLAYADFDGTIAHKKSVPLKSWSPHIKDWQKGDPTWKGKGKGIIGALNYLAGKGCNVFSFLTYNAGGDGDNVWPFVERDAKIHYDCSKLAQWGIVFDHATKLGHYLHFKMQETEIDDNTKNGDHQEVSESLDGGDLGDERRLYCRELIARFGHALALNWNLGEENSQTTSQQKAMSNYIRKMDPYDHLIVVHTFPNQQDKVYSPLLGEGSVLSGMSLQNSHIQNTHSQVVKWIRESEKAGKAWVIAFDESGSAAHGQVPDLGYEGFAGIDSDGRKIYTQHEVRKQTLWGALMGGAAGVEYYFGYKVPQNDLLCEDWRSRDRSWDYCRFALDIFSQIPFAEMRNADELVGNPQHDNSIYCFAKAGEIYLIYLPEGGSASLDLRQVKGEFSVKWFNPRWGGDLIKGTNLKVKSGQISQIGLPPLDPNQDWLALIRAIPPRSF